MRTIGYMCLAYGKEYLKESLLSVRDHVEKFVVLYTPTGSQGKRTSDPFPDTKEELFDICHQVLGDKMIWSEKEYGNEGEHRSDIYRFSDGYDLILTIDSDEVMEPSDLSGALKLAYESDKRYMGINGFINFWRSFNHVCLDGFRPIRITNLHVAENTQGEVPLRIYHFSCAQSDKVVKYKWAVSGHRDELRPLWMDRYLNWIDPQCGDLHPTSVLLWNAIPFDKNSLPQILKDHPNYNKWRIQ